MYIEYIVIIETSVYSPFFVRDLKKNIEKSINKINVGFMSMCLKFGGGGKLSYNNCSNSEDPLGVMDLMSKTHDEHKQTIQNRTW